MKIIVIMPVKNEAWILPYTLKNFSDFADHIIIADQRSIDKTEEICNQFPKVKLINNPYDGYTNEVRFMLLDEARKIEGNNIIVQLDADEFINPDFVKEIHETVKNSNGVVAFRSEWLQLYYNDNSYRVDGVWKDNYKHFAFFDDRKIDYNRDKITNEHINRIPNISNTKTLSLPILHVQSLAIKRCEIKQALYMCTERVDGWNPRKTNNRYSISQFSNNVKTSQIKNEWRNNIKLPNLEDYATYDSTKLDDIFKLFDEKGVEHFEPLNIWHTEELRDKFIKDTGRKPTKIKKFPKWLIVLNNIKNKIKYKIM